MGDYLKIESAASFQKHLKEALPEHASPVYVIASPSDVERRKLVNALVKALGRGEAKRCDELREALEELRSPNLFGGGQVVILEKYTKDLFPYFESPTAGSTLILSVSSFKEYAKAKKNLFFLDLTAEKPWEKKDRLMNWATRRIQSQGKRIQPGALALLFEWLGADLAILEHEIEKLLCYCLDKRDITEQDVKTICAQTQEATGWQLAETCIWDVKCIEIEDVFPLISSLRYHLNIGLQLTTGQGDFPRLRPKTLERYRRISSKLGATYFARGLDALFQLELAAKSSSIPPKTLFERFHATLAS